MCLGQLVGKILVNIFTLQIRENKATVTIFYIKPPRSQSGAVSA